jgi:hypothetical protein
MKLNLIVETDDMFSSEEGIPFEDLLTDALKREIIKTTSKELGGEKFKEFSVLVSETIVSEIKLKMQNFLNEDIAITDQWGKATFIGSIEDLLKQRFDDVLLRPVDSRGNTLQACSSGKTTWIEYIINEKINNKIDSAVDDASYKLTKGIKDTIDQKIKEIMDNSIQEKVGNIFAQYLNQEK